MKECPKCKILHNKDGPFCSRSCGNVRVRSQETKLKISESLIKTNLINGPKGGGWPKGKIKPLRTLEHSKKISIALNKHYDEIGRQSVEQKRAKNVSGVQAYRQRKYSATPIDVDNALIRRIYEKCPTGYEVDHILAIANGGLHHQNNLQYLPAIENRKKNKSDNYNKDLVVKWQDIL